MDELSKISDVAKDAEVPPKIRVAMEVILKSLNDIENRLQSLEIRMTLISKSS